MIGQGSIAAIRIKERVFLVAAATDAEQRAVVESRIPVDFECADSEGQTPAPMFLDRWDRFGFRFYYAPWMRPACRMGATTKNTIRWLISNLPPSPGGAGSCSGIGPTQ